jgi:DNA-directed RNA polymerase specialized sigma24 family protein
MARRTVPSAVNLPPFQTLLDAHGRDIHRFLVASVGRVDADDCYQETWLAALRAYPKLRDASNLRSWIFTVASRKAIDHGRARRRRPVPVADVPEPAGADAGRLTTGASGGGITADGGSGITADDGLWSQVRELPPKQRTALALRYVADAGYDEIAVVMETSEDAARRNVHEALKRLRTEYRQ